MLVLSIMSLVLFVMFAVAMMAAGNDAPEAALGFGIIGNLYGVIFAVIATVLAARRRKKSGGIASLEKLVRLHQQGLVTTDELAAAKARILEKL